MKRKLLPCLAILGLVPAITAGDEPARGEARKDYAELSRLIHKAVAARMPKQYADDSGWGQTIPVPDKLRLPRLRVLVKVGDGVGLPHGLWRKVKVWMDDPARDLAVRVRDLKPLETGKYRLVLEADARMHGWAEVQHWQKGLALVGFIADADATLGLLMEFDVNVTLKAANLPPEIHVDPKLTTLKTDLQDFALRQVTLRRLGTVLEGDQARQFGDQFKDILQDVIRAFEPAVKDAANEAIAQALREGRGRVSAGALLKALTPSRPKE